MTENIVYSDVLHDGRVQELCINKNSLRLTVTKHPYDVTDSIVFQSESELYFKSRLGFEAPYLGWVHCGVLKGDESIDIDFTPFNLVRDGIIERSGADHSFYVLYISMIGMGYVVIASISPITSSIDPLQDV
jgi:hypothetical protein